MTHKQAAKIVYGNEPTSANEFYAARAYLTAERIASQQQYLSDVAAGVDTVKAWNDHKSRMSQAA